MLSQSPNGQVPRLPVTSGSKQGEAQTVGQVVHEFLI